MITSRHNSRVAAIRRLRARRHRDESGLFYAEGIRQFLAAVDAGVVIDVCLVAPHLLRSEVAIETVSRLQTDGLEVLEVSPEVFHSLSLREGPQGIGVVGRQSWLELKDVDPSNDLSWVVLDSAQDPGNVGTILRTSDAAGSRGVIFLGNSVDPYDPTALRASMGSIFSQPLVRTNFEDLLPWLNKHDCFLAATSDRGATDYRRAIYRSPTFLLMGSERQGLSAEQQAVADVVVRIPMRGRADSLNVAVATSLVLYEVFRQAHPLD